MKAMDSSQNAKIVVKSSSVAIPKQLNQSYNRHINSTTELTMLNQTMVSPRAVEMHPSTLYKSPNVGIQLWPLFEQVFTSCMGYAPQDFHFETAPLSTSSATLSALIAYYAIIFGGREVMRPYKPIQLNRIFKLHNLALTILSSLLLALFLEQLVPTLVSKGLFAAVCHADGGWTDNLVILYYVRIQFPT